MVACPGRFALTYLEDIGSESGPAADTGTAAHLGVKLWHEGEDFERIREVVRSSTGEFPKADLDEAEKFIRNYTKDPRNYPDSCVAVEMKLDFTLPPHPYDPTGKPIYCSGTADQVRKSNVGFQVWDYKTGVAQGSDMLNWFMPQLAAYTYGLRETFHDKPYIGGIIRARGYTIRGKNKAENSPDGVFFDAVPNEPDVCLSLLTGVRLAVALIRRGEPFFASGEVCKHCPFQSMGTCQSIGRRYGLVVLE